MHSHEVYHDCPARVVCQCLQITETQLVDALHTLKLRTVKDVCRATGAGDGCTACHEVLKQYLEQHAYCFSSPICSVK